MEESCQQRAGILPRRAALLKVRSHCCGLPCFTLILCHVALACSMLRLSALDAFSDQKGCSSSGWARGKGMAPEAGSRHSAAGLRVKSERTKSCGTVTRRGPE